MAVNPKYLELQTELYEARKQYAIAQANVNRRVKKMQALMIELRSLDLDLMEIFEPATEPAFLLLSGG